MALRDKRYCFTFMWTVENVSYSSRKRHEWIRSPTFVINELYGSKYHLILYLGGESDDNYIDFRLQSEVYGYNSSFVKIDCEIALLSKDGSVLTLQKKAIREFSSDFCRFKERKDIFDTNKSTYLFEDKLRVRCKIWKSDGDMTEHVQCFACSRIYVQTHSFLWKIKNFSNIQSEEKFTYQLKSVQNNEVLMTFDLFIKNPYTDEDALTIQLLSEDGKIKYFILQLIPLSDSLSDNKGIRKEFLFCEKEKQKLLTLPFSKEELIVSKSFCIPDNVLTFRCECTFSTNDIIEEIKTVTYGCESLASTKPDDERFKEENDLSVSKQVLSENLKSLFHENILSDIKIKTNAKIYLAHKNILSARSPVFKAMFSNDMKEKITECVDIDDLDSNAVYRMLNYIYTSEIPDLECEDCCELYKAAHKYDIKTLRDDCSTRLKSKLRSTNACDILIFADTYNENDLKNSVQQFIFDHDIINSDEWSQLMENYLKLAAETMRLQIQRKQLSSKLTYRFDYNDAETTCASSAFNQQHQSSFQFNEKSFDFSFSNVSAGPFLFASALQDKDLSGLAQRKITKAKRRILNKV